MSFPDTTMHESVQQANTASDFVNRKSTGTQWVIEQLHILRYQHILEIGFKNGRLLQEAAERLGTGLIAGIEESVEMYTLALRKNRLEIGSELMQLHPGTIAELPYPAYYFDTIYGYNTYNSWQKPENVLMQLHRLLKAGGRLVLFFEIPSMVSDQQAVYATDVIEKQLTDEGFSQIQISSGNHASVNCLAVSGFKL